MSFLAWPTSCEEGGICPHFTFLTSPVLYLVMKVLVLDVKWVSAIVTHFYPRLKEKVPHTVTLISNKTPGLEFPTGLSTIGPIKIILESVRMKST